MNVNEMVRNAKRSKPNLKALPDEEARALVKEVLQQIREEVDMTDDGLVKIPTFGRFRVKQGKREKNGQTMVVKRVVFLAAKPKKA
jgi:nucleoid DNA-binding protein